MDELLNRQAPHSLEAEQAVLGAMLIDPQCVAEIITVLKPDDFYTDINRKIFEVIYSMFNYSQAIDAVTVLEQMKTAGDFNEESTPAYLMDLMKITPTSSNAVKYAEIVRNNALLRNILQTSEEIHEMVYSNEQEAAGILEAAERKIYALRQGRTIGGLVPISAVVGDVYKRLGELYKNGGSIPGLSTGFSDLDNLIMGLNKSDLILMASRPGMGKTSFALNIALNVGKSSGKTIAVFSLEMSREQLVMRLLSSEAFVENGKLLTGRLSQEDWRKIAAASASISKTDIRIDDNSAMTVAEMNAQCRRIEDLGLVIIDYLQLMQGSGGRSHASESRVQVVSDISRMLKIMAKELNVPVICLSQLSRANVLRQNKRPVLSDLRESGALEQDADIVLALYREEYFEKEAADTHNTAECIVLKNRHGSTGTVELQWLPEYTAFSSAEWRYDED